MGKSTLLNCLIKAKKPDIDERLLFKGGIAIGNGTLTFILEYILHIYIEHHRGVKIREDWSFYIIYYFSIVTHGLLLLK